MAVNVRGVFLGCKYAIPQMLEQGSGSIINIASFVAILGCSVPQDAYTASKGAVLALTRSLAVQFAGRGVRSNSISPGPIETPLLMDWLLKDEAAKQLRLNRNPVRPLRQARGDRQRRDLPGVGRVDAGRTGPTSSSTAGSPSTTSDRDPGRTARTHAVDTDPPRATPRRLPRERRGLAARRRSAARPRTTRGRPGQGGPDDRRAGRPRHAPGGHRRGRRRQRDQGGGGRPGDGRAHLAPTPGPDAAAVHAGRGRRLDRAGREEDHGRGEARARGVRWRRLPGRRSSTGSRRAPPTWTRAGWTSTPTPRWSGCSDARSTW